MKWVILEKALRCGMEALYAPSLAANVQQKKLGQNDDRDTRTFTTYDSEEILETDLILSYHEWYSKTFSYTFHSELHYTIFKKHYEIYVGGYLTYYDYVVKKNHEDHSIHFIWPEFSETDKDKEKEYTVKVLISSSPKLCKKPNGKNNPNAFHSQPEKVNGALADLPGPSAEVDPVPPPGPPPPEP